jgi:hypothetical protein
LEDAMAFYPCDYGPHYNPARNYLLYVGYGAGTEINRWRLRFCGTHLSTVQEHLSEFEVSPEDGALAGGNEAMTHCLSCGQPIGENRRQLFVTCYPPDHERKDYWAGVHVNCSLPDVIHDKWASKSA